MYLTNVYPKPETLCEDRTIRFVFNSRVIAYISAPEGAAAPDNDLLERMKYLWYHFSRTASSLDILPTCSKSAQNGHFFELRIADAPPSPGNISHFAISSDKNGVALRAVSPKALMDGFATLVQLICPIDLSEGSEELYIAKTELTDSPRLKFRAIHICVFPDSELSELEKAIHMAGLMKLTHVVLEFWGTFRYRAMPELAWRDRAVSEGDIRGLVSLIRSYGMEVIPMFNHFGHAAQSRSCYGRHTVLNASPRRAMLFEPDGWTWCLSNPDTYKLLSELRAELTELCGDGEYFHLGFDEAYSFATCEACRKRVPSELLCEYLNRLTDELDKNGRRPIIWHDELIRRADFAKEFPDPIVANGQSHGTAEAIADLDRRIIIADWQYDYRHTGEGGVKNPTAAYFSENGFEVILCPWDDMRNVRVLCEDARLLGAHGVMLTTWHHLNAYLAKLPSAAEYAWRAAPPYTSVPITEVAALLRTVYPTNGDYVTSGWNPREI